MTAAADNGAHLINDVRGLAARGCSRGCSHYGLASVSYAYAESTQIHAAKPSVSGCCQRSHRVSAAAPRTMLAVGIDAQQLLIYWILIWLW